MEVAFFLPKCCILSMVLLQYEGIVISIVIMLSDCNRNKYISPNCEVIHLWTECGFAGSAPNDGDTCDLPELQWGKQI